MANTLTGLISTIYEAVDIIGREMVGAIPAVSIDAAAESAAKDQVITFPIVPAVANSTPITPGVFAPDSGDQAIGYDSMSITKEQMVPVRWSANEQKALNKGGVRANIERDRFVQAMRTLVNEMESDILLAAKNGASRAYGTAGTAPFASAIADAAQLAKILDDNGCPQDNQRSLIINSAAAVNLRSLTNLTSVYAAGTDQTLRQGTILPLVGFDIKQSAKIANHIKGTGSAYVTSGITGSGVSDIALVSGANPVLAGDIVTFAADANNKYVVKTGVAAAGTISLQKPGAIVTIATGNAMTIGNSYAANIGFHKGAIYLLTRTPAMPDEGDAADDVISITDPLTGIVFQVAMYKQYKQIHYEVGLAWGVKVVKPEFVATLLG